MPSSAQERKGIQPTLSVKANGQTRAETKIGKKITFTADIEIPAGTGQLVAAEWDFEGLGTFPITTKFKLTDKSALRYRVKTTYKFIKSGTYFPTLKVTAQRQGDSKTPFARIQNLGRVRVVIK